MIATFNSNDNPLNPKWWRTPILSLSLLVSHCCSFQACHYYQIYLFGFPKSISKFEFSNSYESQMITANKAYFLSNSKFPLKKSPKHSKMLVPHSQIFTKKVPIWPYKYSLNSFIKGSKVNILGDIQERRPPKVYDFWLKKRSCFVSKKIQ